MFKFKLYCDRWSVGQSVLREDGPVIYCRIASGPCQSSHSWVEVPQNSRPYFTVSFETHQPEGPGPCIYIPQEQGGPVIPPGTGFPFCRLLRLAGQRWRYSNPPPNGVDMWIKVKVMLRQMVSQYVLMSSSLWNLWPDVIFCLNVAVLSLWGSLSDERSGLSPVSHFHQCLVHCQRCNVIYIVHVTCFKYMQYILDLSQHWLSTADHANIYATTAN
jgi:hypothetical protein